MNPDDKEDIRQLLDKLFDVIIKENPRAPVSLLCALKFFMSIITMWTLTMQENGNEDHANEALDLFQRIFQTQLSKLKREKK